jgi:hypothetical protein
MRFMLLMHPNITEEQYAEGPKAEDVAEMMAFNEELTKAGVLLALDGLLPPSEGAHVTRRGGRTTVIDGPFSEAKELVGGYWIIQARSKEEAVEWASRCPMSEGDVIEVRRIADVEDYPQDVQEVAHLSQEPPAQPVER